jgi:hypothetical protein
MAGAVTVFLPEQTRALPELASAYNNVTYQNRLTHAPSAPLVHRPVVQAVDSTLLISI